MVNQNNSSAIACASGGFKAIFVHGVLSALESAGFRADAYSAASASVVVAAFASVNRARKEGIDYWFKGMEVYHHTKNLSQVSLSGIEYFDSNCGEELFNQESQFYIAASKVITEEAAQQTQSKQARRLGKKLLISAGKKERSWVDKHMKLDLFSTASKDNLALNRNNFTEVAYASTRMLHIYDQPAWIDHKPYVDASYTCICPALEMVDRGFQTIIAIATETGKFYRDLFQSEVIPREYKQASIHIIKPDINPKDFGVDVFQATQEGLAAVYQHGLDKGKEFLAQSNN